MILCYQVMRVSFFFHQTIVYSLFFKNRFLIQYTTYMTTFYSHQRFRIVFSSLSQILDFYNGMFTCYEFGCLQTIPQKASIGESCGLFFQNEEAKTNDWWPSYAHWKTWTVVAWSGFWIFFLLQMLIFGGFKKTELLVLQINDLVCR